jgi:hypothetical protein
MQQVWALAAQELMEFLKEKGFSLAEEALNDMLVVPE